MRLLFPSVLLIWCSCTDSTSTVHRASRLLILVQPLGSVSESVIDSATKALEREHDAIVLRGTPRELPTTAFTTLKTPRYRADTLIAWLKLIKPDSVDLIVGITGKDISLTKLGRTGAIKEPISTYRDYGVFGLAYIGGPSCVVSTFRLGAEPQISDRLKKIVVHEIGHNRYLPHCPDPTCVMRDAVERISSIDAAGASLCAICTKQIEGSVSSKR